MKKGDMRESYGEALRELGEVNKNIVVVGADTTQSLKASLFGNKYPERFFNVGIAESNAISIAAGLSLVGKIAYTSTYAAFIPGKCVDQIRNAIALPNLNVKIVVSHGGLSVGPDGASHQQLEDIGIIRAIPNMRVLVPSDAIATKKLTYLIANIDGPFYMRIARPSSPIIYNEREEFELGKAKLLRDGNDITLIACGLMVYEALEAANTLKSLGISASVIDMFSIKPIDKEAIVNAANTNGIITIEEHNIYGGLGSAVAEVICENKPTRLKRIGVEDRFGESGEADELLDKYGLKAKHIVEKAKEFLKDR
jgi:transketolase